MDAVLNRTPGGEVERSSVCTYFSPRKSMTVARRECWYCRYADFHLNEEVPLEVGACCYPQVQVNE